MEFIKHITNISQFNAWSGAIPTLERIIKENKTDDFEMLLEDMFHDKTPTETDINDFLWFEEEFIFKNLNISEYE